MNKFIIKGLICALIIACAAIAALPVLTADGIAFAQDVADTPTAEPTAPPPTATAVPTPVSPSDPAQIPEPITVILFGSGLAALSASVAKKRKKQ